MVDGKCREICHSLIRVDGLRLRMIEGNRLVKDL